MRERSFYVSWEPNGPRDENGRPEWLGHDDTGGYKFPVLEHFGDFSIVSYHIPEDDDELSALEEHVRDPKSILSYVEDGKVVVVRGGKSLKDMGITVNTTDDGSGKTVKRAKTLARPFRIHTHRTSPLQVKVIEGGPELDGCFVVSPEIYREACDNVELPGFHPVQQAELIRYLDGQMVHNARGLGDMIDVETGDFIKKFLKGNCIVAATGTMPKGVDVITTEDNLKDEMFAEGNGSWLMFEPQSSKVAWEDQQTVVNQQFALSIPEARTRMEEYHGDALEKLTRGDWMQSSEELSREEFRKEYAFDGDGFARLLRWNANNWALHNMSYTDSPWLTERLGISHTKTVAVDNRRKLRIPIPGAIRAQVVTQALVNLAGYKANVDYGELTWLKECKVAVVNDDHWIEHFIGTHGGCDLDDFFVLRRNNDDAVITRSPNTRGEYTEISTVLEWWPDSEDARPMNRKSRPTPILEAEETGETKYRTLPSVDMAGPKAPMRPYTPEDCLTELDALRAINGGYGQYELAVRAYHSMTWEKNPKHIPEQYNSEDAVDTFTQGGDAEDRKAILEFVEEIRDMIRETGKGVDPLLRERLGLDDNDDSIPVDENGPLTRIKQIQMETEAAFMSALLDFTVNIEAPAYLENLADPALVEQAQLAIRSSRRAMWNVDGPMAIRGVQEEIFLPLIDSIEDTHAKMVYALSFWYACFVTPTSRGKVTDQAVFGTDMLNHVLDALVYFGIAKRPEVTDDGTIVRTNPVEYERVTHSVHLTCGACDFTYEYMDIAAVETFHSNDGVCNKCRG